MHWCIHRKCIVIAQLGISVLAYLTMAVSVEKIKSEKSKDLLVVENYKFCFHKELKDGVRRWCCVNKKCKSFLKTDASDSTLLDSKLECAILHEPESDNKLCRQKIRNSVKETAKENLCERPWKIMHKEINKENSEVLTKRDVDCIRKGIYSSRRTVIPTLPKNMSSVHVALDSLISAKEIIFVNIDLAKISLFLLTWFFCRLCVLPNRCTLMEHFVTVPSFFYNYLPSIS